MDSCPEAADAWPCLAQMTCHSDQTTPQAMAAAFFAEGSSPASRWQLRPSLSFDYGHGNRTRIATKISSAWNACTGWLPTCSARRRRRGRSRRRGGCGPACRRKFELPDRHRSGSVLQASCRAAARKGVRARRQTGKQQHRVRIRTTRLHRVAHSATPITRLHVTVWFQACADQTTTHKPHNNHNNNNNKLLLPQHTERL
jgi:hypothetical protein